jgi:hypothetical protein
MMYGSAADTNALQRSVKNARLILKLHTKHSNKYSQKRSEIGSRGAS